MRKKRNLMWWLFIPIKEKLVTVFVKDKNKKSTIIKNLSDKVVKETLKDFPDEYWNSH